MHRHTISVLVENKFGVLARVAGMFSGRGFNIHSVNVGPSHNPEISRMTLVVNAKDDRVVDQIIKQLDKLVDVIQVIDFRAGESVEREMVLLQIEVDSRTRAEVIELCDIFRAKIVDVSTKVLTIEVTGDEAKVNKFILLMDHFGIKDLTRTGKIALPSADGLEREIIST